MQKVYGNDIAPSCSYCQFGRLSPNEECILCVKKGVMLPTSHCKKFKYDALKRQPKPRQKIFTDYSPEDFAL